MIKLVWIGILFLLSVQLACSQKIVGCYWGSWTSIDRIDIKLCTHAYFAFYTTDANGVITTTSPQSTVSSFLALKSQNPTVKLIASIGGYNAGTAAFSAIAANPSLLSNFVSNCVALAQQFDGIDIDWEYPEPFEQQSFVNMLGVLKSALSTRGKVLAIAVGAGTWRISQSYSIAAVCNNIDLLNLMSYDMQWPYSVTGTNAGYSIIDKAVSIWINGGCPANKIVLGLASYGYNFNLISSSNVAIGAGATGASALSYRDICNKLKTPGWTTIRNDQTPISYKGNEWISYDDVASLSAKLNIINSRNLVGAFFWSTEQDDYDNSCGMGKFPLMTSVYTALRGSPSNIVAPTTEPAPAPVTNAPTQAPIITTTNAPTQAPAPAPVTNAPTQAPITTTTNSASGATFNNPVVDFYANPLDCTKFYRFVWGTPYSFSCPAGTGWSQSIQTCVLKSNIPGCF